MLLSVMGDSISTYEGCNPAGFAVYYQGERAVAAGLRGCGDTWWGLVADRIGARVCANGSWSGSMVEGAGMPAGQSSGRIEALRGDAGEVPDLLLVFMGTNDYGWGSARAQAAARVAAVPPTTNLDEVAPAVAGAAGLDDLAGFERAYAAMLEGLRAAYPATEVCCLTLLPGRVVGSARPTFCHNLRGVPLRAYNEAIRRAAAAAGARVADVEAFGLDYEAVDGTHPTRRGHAQIAALVVSAMTGEGLDLAAFGGDVTAWASAELCPGRACVGCAHARGTGNAWSCVCERQLVSATAV